MKKILLFLLVSLLLVGCGKKKDEDPLLALGYKLEDNKYVSGNVILTRENNAEYNSVDVIIEEVITDKPNTALFVNSIKHFINIEDKIISDGLELLVDAYNENEKSSQINIYNEGKYYLELYITNDKKVMAIVLTPRAKGRKKDGKYLLNDDLGYSIYYSAARRSSNIEKNTNYDEMILKNLFNKEVRFDIVKQVANDALKNCNPDEICENYYQKDYEVSILAKNGLYSTFYNFDNKTKGLYYRSIHSMETYKEDLGDDLDMMSKDLNKDLNKYKDDIINKIEKKDYKLTEDENHLGKHYIMEIDPEENVKMEIDIYEKSIIFDCYVSE